MDIGIPLEPETELERSTRWWDALSSNPPLLRYHVNPYSQGREASSLEEIYPALAPCLPESPRILDIGCGLGRVAIAMARRVTGACLVGLDISRTMRDRAIASAEAAGVAQSTFQYVIGDGASVPPSVGSIDAAYSMLTFQHLPANVCRWYVASVGGALKPGGRFRFQSSIGTDDSFLAHPTSESAMVSWCSGAGLDVLCVERSKIHHEWAWVTAEKP